MAGTGFGKSCILEMDVHLFATSKKPVVLVLNPLDALGNNQLQEKIQQGYTAVNLKKLTFNPKVANQILHSSYTFVYLSLEVYLNNELFTEIYYNTKFQERLVLTVVDKAHMIYSWGLVASGKAKKSKANKRHQDRALFWPSYGDLGTQLMATEDSPILLLSATCWPLAIAEILKCLSIEESNINFVQGELTRPKICILQFPMNCSLKSANNCAAMFASKEQFDDDLLVSTLIYSGTRNTTLEVMKVVNEAWATPTGENNPKSHLICCYHACTGDTDKEDTILGYEDGSFPMISCTMALGLEQNWKRVHCVIHMGRGDPLSICQIMIGRCGRDGKPGLAILFMEKKRKSGINQLGGLTGPKVDKEADDTRMDALAVTPVQIYSN
ncbi:hypothetical protein PCANC_26595 [Puccinia coronata f. sp. avenae]|uniref:DNA 3'-5' helicase n=1 Tax=Puccinia coronata f. sp. avenae TaxID=200324 RepID=A0A2N5RWQ9_9BASI|nr:hypothetical protein PCANC_26595 [Puccinia coronata f. sp. avenae]